LMSFVWQPIFVRQSVALVRRGLGPQSQS
jgi:hypothetical protein